MKTFIRLILSFALALSLGGFGPVMLPSAVPFEPDQLSNPVHFWVRSDRGVARVGSNLVASWEDLSGNGYNVSEGSNRPLYVADQLNGFAGIRFDGSNDRLSNSVSGSHAQPFTIFAVMKTVSWTNFDYIITTHSGNAWETRHHTSSPQIRIGGDAANVCAVSLAIGTWALVRTYSNGSSTVQEINNDGQPSTCNPGGTAAFDAISLGSSTSPGNFSNIELAEVLIVGGNISATDLTAIKTYFRERYKLWSE